MRSTTVDVQVRVDPAAADGVALQYDGSAVISNGEEADEVLIVFVSTSPLLILEKTADRSVAGTNQTITYTLNYEVAGFEARDVVLSDFLPSEVILDSASGSPQENIAAGTLTWELGDLSPGVAGSVSVTVRTGNAVIDGSQIKNLASLEAVNAQSVTATAIVRASSKPELAITKQASADVISAGDRLV